MRTCYAIRPSHGKRKEGPGVPLPGVLGCPGREFGVQSGEFGGEIIAVWYSELRTPNSELRTPNSELRTPN